MEGVDGGFKYSSSSNTGALLDRTFDSVIRHLLSNAAVG